MDNHFDLPFLGYGVGLRPPHYSHIFEHQPNVDWFEIISENYMDTGGRPIRMLERVLEHYPVVMHGVSLSIGTIDPINSDYLTKLKALADWVKPAWISDHLCWTGIAHKNTHDLLPVPYTEEALTHLIERIKRVQDFLGRPLLLENPSTYLEFSASSMPEWEFLARMAEGADCALLLDANNIYVSCYNHRWDAKEYIDALPLERVGQIHLAGHTNKGTHIIDTHDDHVTQEVWNLYGYIMNKAKRPISTMVEWDGKIPDFEIVEAEVNKARKWGEIAENQVQFPSFTPYRRNDAPAPKNAAYSDLLGTLQASIFEGNSTPENWVLSKPDFSPAEQVEVYTNGYRYRLFDIVHDDYPTLLHYLGKPAFKTLVDDYLEAIHSTSFNISHYVRAFPAHVQQQADSFAHELATLETHISQLVDAPETTPLTPENMGMAYPNLSPESFMELTLHGRSALQLLAFNHNVNDYYNAVREEGAPAVTKKPSYLAVYRHEDTMWRLPLEETEYQLLTSLFGGKPIAEAMAEALPQDADEADLAANLSAWFGRWMNNGLLAMPKA